MFSNSFFEEIDFAQRDIEPIQFELERIPSDFFNQFNEPEHLEIKFPEVDDEYEQFDRPSLFEPFENKFRFEMPEVKKQVKTKEEINTHGTTDDYTKKS